jgi:hypothetical protein
MMQFRLANIPKDQNRSSCCAPNDNISRQKQNVSPFSLLHFNDGISLARQVRHTWGTFSISRKSLAISAT